MPPGHRGWLPGRRDEPDPTPDEDDPAIGDLDDAAIIIADPVLKHRFERFTGLGFTIPQARRMALDRNIDTWQAKNLIRKGCDPMLAFDILS